MSFDKLKFEVIDKDLCEGCGLCAGFCKAITLEDGVPSLTGKCILTKGAKSCGLCFDLCPQAHPVAVTTEEFQPLHAAGVKSTNDEVLEVASNGGFVTEFLQMLLKKQKIDAVTAVTGEKRAPEALTVTKPSEVLQLAGTKYSPSGVLNEFGNNIRANGKKIAVVGLPCEIRGVRRLENRLGLEFLKIGLFCSNNNRTNEEGKTEKLGSCTHCQDFFASKADIACGFAGAEKGFTTVVALTDYGQEMLDLAIKSGRFETTDSDLSKVKAAQTRKSKRELIEVEPGVRERIIRELTENGPGEVTDIAKRMNVRPDDIIYHLLVLQDKGHIHMVENRHDPYKIVWDLE